MSLDSHFLMLTCVLLGVSKIWINRLNESFDKRFVLKYEKFYKESESY
jgi:hypothetical protein